MILPVTLFIALALAVSGPREQRIGGNKRAYQLQKQILFVIF